MIRPVCAKCKVEYFVKKQGVYVVSMFSSPPLPYKIYHADLWECPGCGHQIIGGFGDGALAEHYESSFEKILSNVRMNKEKYFECYEAVEDVPEKE